MANSEKIEQLRNRAKREVDEGLLPSCQIALALDGKVIHFETFGKATDENRGLAEIIIGKQRNGPTGTVKLAFLKEFTRFENFDWRGGN